jgi:hypothetical protein
MNETQMNEAAPAVAESVDEAPQPFVENRPPPPPVAAPATPTIRPTSMPTQSISRSVQDAARVLKAASIEEAARKQAAGAADAAAREEERSKAQMASSRQVNAPFPTPPQEYTDPEAWLKDIRELRKENKQEQADQEWRRFREAFPKYEVAETDAAREPKK